MQNYTILMAHTDDFVFYVVVNFENNNEIEYGKSTLFGSCCVHNRTPVQLFYVDILTWEWQAFEYHSWAYKARHDA